MDSNGKKNAVKSKPKKLTGSNNATDTKKPATVQKRKIDDKRRRTVQSSDSSSSSDNNNTNNNVNSSGGSSSRSSSRTRSSYSTSRSGSSSGSVSRSSSSSSSSNSSIKTSPKPKNKPPVRNKHRITGDDSSDNYASGSDVVEISEPPPRGVQKYKRKELVAAVLCRWWHCMPPWPPEDFSYEKALAERKLRWVSIGDWEDLDDVDGQGYTKVYQVSHYPGVFRDPSGKAIDVRPLEGKPSFCELNKKLDEELYQLLIKALKTQIEEIKYSPFWGTEAHSLKKLEARLKNQLEDAENILNKIRRRQKYLERRKRFENTTE